MHKRTRYTLLSTIILIVVLAVKWYYVDIDLVEDASEVMQTRSTFDEFFIPSSTLGQVVHHKGYSLSYNEDHEQAEWIAYELKKSHLSKTNFKRPYFKVDKNVKTGAQHWRNYKGSGYDKGHLCPAGDRRYSKQAHDETFLTSNIAPQEHRFNSGIWNRLEQKVRYWAKKYNGVFVVTGGVLEKGLTTIGEEEVSVPDYFYKVLIDINTGRRPKMIAFLIPHKETKKPLYEFVVSVDEIESLTGIDFFSQLDDTIEDRLEASSSYKGWSFK